MMSLETTYREYLPSKFLLPYIECYWHYCSKANIPLEEQPIKRCLPLGTLELIIQVDHTPSIIFNNKEQVWQKSNTIYFTGLFKDTCFWKGSPGSLMFGIRMKPEALIELFKLPVACLFSCVAVSEL